jgi:hypothetical protein
LDPWKLRDALLGYYYNKRHAGVRNPRLSVADFVSSVGWQGARPTNEQLNSAFLFLSEMGYCEIDWDSIPGPYGDPFDGDGMITAKGETLIGQGLSVLDPKGARVYNFSGAQGNFQIESSGTQKNY